MFDTNHDGTVSSMQVLVKTDGCFNCLRECVLCCVVVLYVCVCVYVCVYLCVNHYVVCADA